MDWAAIVTALGGASIGGAVAKWLTSRGAEKRKNSAAVAAGYERLTRAQRRTYDEMMDAQQTIMKGLQSEIAQLRVELEAARAELAAARAEIHGYREQAARQQRLAIESHKPS